MAGEGFGCWFSAPHTHQRCCVSNPSASPVVPHWLSASLQQRRRNARWRKPIEAVVERRDPDPAPEPRRDRRREHRKVVSGLCSMADIRVAFHIARRLLAAHST